MNEKHLELFDDGSIAQRLSDIMLDCFFRDDELIEGQQPTNVVVVEGITARVGFHPGRLQSHRREVTEIISLMPKKFFKTGGGGWSFLNLCTTEAGVQWGEHTHCEMLVVLAIGLGIAHFTMSRPMWKDLPGGVPYVCFDLEGARAGRIDLDVLGFWLAMIITPLFLWLCWHSYQTRVVALRQPIHESRFVDAKTHKEIATLDGFISHQVALAARREQANKDIIYLYGSNQ